MRPWLYLLLLLLSVPLCAERRATPATSADAGRVIVHTCWSATSLYIAFHVDDSVIVGNQNAPLSQPWLDDAVAVYLNLDPRNTHELDQSCLRVVISAAGGASVQCGDHGEWRDDQRWFQFNEHGTIRYGVKILGKLNDTTGKSKGYTVAIGLSWELLGVAPPFLVHQSDPLPGIGFAMACYSQGETQSVSCWPHTLSETDLLQPGKWGLLQFTQNSELISTQEPLASATYGHDPLITGELNVTDWITAGVQVFPRRWGETPVANLNQPNISILAAEYLLTPPELDAMHQPYQPNIPGLGADAPLYHTRQLRDIKSAGIDALAVVWPADAHARDLLRPQLSALVDALADYDQALSTVYQYNVPLLLPMIDFSTASLDLRNEKDLAALAAGLDDFYRLVPPQYRFMVVNPSGVQCTPVIFTAPSSTVHWDASFAARLDAHFTAQWGMPIGWMLDGSWKTNPEPRDVLCYCQWKPNNVQQFGEGALSCAMIAPGFIATRKEHFSRRDGEVYENGWLKMTGATPNFILLRSWNDFTRASEIAPSRQFGYQFVDSTKVSLLRLAHRRGFGVRLMSHTLPRVLLPGQSYPTDVVVKNGTLTKMVTSDGFRVDYHILHGSESITSGIATGKIVLFETATARVHFTLFTGTDHQHPLPEGDYTLSLDFRHNRTPFFSLALLTQTLGTMSIPFTISKAHVTAQLIRCEAPRDATYGSVQPITVQCRNLTPDSWRKGKTYVHARWRNSDDTAASAEVDLPCPRSVSSGDVITLHADLPPAPQQAGWYHLQLLSRDNAGKDQVLGESAVSVSETHPRAQFLNITLQDEISAQEHEVEVPIALRNPGGTPWLAKESRVVYQWVDWDGQRIPGATGSAALPGDVPSRGALTMRMMITPPPGSGPFRCTFSLVSGGQTALLQTNPLNMIVPSSPVKVRPAKFSPVDLQKAFNGFATSAETVVLQADVDGHGNQFPLEEFLPDTTNPPLGYRPGYYLDPPDATAPYFHYALEQAAGAPLLRANGQEVALPPSNSIALHLAALKTGATDLVSFGIRYTDGSEVTVPVHMTNWLELPAFHEPVIMRSHYLRTARGEDWYLHASIFSYRLPLDPARTVKSIVLPQAPDVCLFAVSLEMPDKTP